MVGRTGSSPCREVDDVGERQRIRFLLIRDHKENKHKCTLSPLEGREGYRFLDLRRPASPPVVEEITGGILLTTGAPVMTPRDRELLDGRAITIIDSTWARVPSVLARIRVVDGDQLVRRSLPSDIVTAYPRTSKLFRDPECGLASIEAVFAALVVLGAADVSVLDGYRWRTQFLRQNDLTWRRLGWDPRLRLSPSSLYGR